MVKEFIEKMDATPTKNIYSSIISDYTLELAVCELIDNVLDNIMRNNISERKSIKIVIDQRRSVLTITDNAIGVNKDNLVKLVSPGQSDNQRTGQSIGLFGVGSKRAAVALAEQINITSRFSKEDTYSFEYNDGWLQNGEDWDVELFKVDNIDEDTTIIELSRLRFVINDDAIERLKDHISEVYIRYIDLGIVEINFCGEIIKSDSKDNWAYPPDYSPTKFTGVFDTDAGHVFFDMLVGLVRTSNPRGDFGLTLYCNDRLISKNNTSYEIGYYPGQIGNVHPSISLVNAVVSLKGPAGSMPWNSSKSGIDYNHEVFTRLRELVIEPMKQYSAISRRTSGNWDDEIFKFNSGEIGEYALEGGDKIKRYLPILPISKPNYIKNIKKMNEQVEREKPYTAGIHDSISIIPNILKFKIDTNPRIALIVLDSTLEIAFKNYLVYDSGTHYSNDRLKDIFKSRHKVHEEVKKHHKKSLKWDKIQYYYDMRNLAVHNRADSVIERKSVSEYELIVKETVSSLFGSKF